ncbi:MAG TPA: hypothetical protein V6C58_01385 [Allocoleopsis sp.]
MVKKGYNHGGARENAGRKSKFGVPVKHKLVPKVISDEILNKFIMDYVKEHGLLEKEASTIYMVCNFVNTHISSVLSELITTRVKLTLRLFICLVTPFKMDFR